MLKDRDFSIILRCIDSPNMRVTDSMGIKMADEIVRLQKKVAQLERLVPPNTKLF